MNQSIKDHKNIYLLSIVLSIIFVVFLFFTGCQKTKNDESKKNSKNDKKPPALTELMQLSEDIVTMTQEKRWNEASEKIKTMHTKWNQFYPYGQKSGLSSEHAQEFRTDLNKVTNLIMNKAMEETKKNAQWEYQKAQIKLNIQEQQSPSSQKDQKKGSDSSNASDSGSEEEKSNNDSQKKGDDKTSNEEQTPKIELPQEVAEKYNAILHTSSDDLLISHAAIQLTKHIPNFLSLYEEDISPSVLRLKYYVRDIKTTGTQENWDLAEKNIEKIKELWSLIQPHVIKQKEELSLQFTQSIADLEEIILEENAQLIALKCDIVLANIDKMMD